MLLELIEMLPGTSRYHEAMSMDEESMRAYIAANGGKPPKGDIAPPLHAWTQEASLLAMLVEEIRGLKAIMVKVNSKPGASVPKQEPIPRPKSAWPKIENELRLSKHAHLVAMLIPKQGAV